LHRHLLHRVGGGRGIRKREGRKNDAFVELFHEGVNSSFKGCCFGGGLAVGLAQGHLFQGHLVHLSRQVVKLVDDCLEGIFEELVLASTESDDSLFDFVEVLFVLVVHRAGFIDLFAEEDNVVLYPLVVFELL
jgi:hypothetical protein